MVTEEDVVRALPENGFVRNYVIHAMKQTTAPLCYHLGVGLTLLSTTCPINYGMWYAGALRPNMFTLLIGRSGEDNKSSALNVGQGLLFSAAPDLIGDYPGSAEGLIDSLSNKPVQVIPISEFGRFLSSAQGGYFEQIKTLLADLWDCGAVQRAKANGRVTRVDNPRLSIMAACSIPYLEKHTLAEDWSGGFMGRWAVMYGQRVRVDPDPIGDRTATDYLVNELERRAKISNAGWCNGMTPEAKKLWNAWFTDLNNRRLPSHVMGVRSRAPTLARKVALIYGWDYGLAMDGQEWLMDVDVLSPAIKFAELHIKSLVGLSGKIADHPDARMRREVINALDFNGKKATLGQVLGHLQMRKRPVVEILDSLIEEGRVRKIADEYGIAYHLLDS
jgi:hypothetical protein